MNHPITKPNLIVLILALAATLFILWRVLIIGMSEYYVDKAINGDTGAIRSALSWNANHPKAQYLEARQISASDPDKAEILLTASLLGLLPGCSVIPAGDVPVVDEADQLPSGYGGIRLDQQLIPNYEDVRSELDAFQLAQTTRPLTAAECACPAIRKTPAPIIQAKLDDISPRRSNASADTTAIMA